MDGTGADASELRRIQDRERNGHRQYYTTLNALKQEREARGAISRAYGRTRERLIQQRDVQCRALQTAANERQVAPREIRYIGLTSRSLR